MATPNRIKQILRYGRGLLGIKYEWWKGGELPKDAPMWTRDEKLDTNLKIDSVNCSGLLNLMLRSINVPLPKSDFGGIGGTMAYYDYFKSKNVTRVFDRTSTKVYPEGTLIGRRYKDVHDQGHVAVITLRENGVNGVLQSIPDEGVTEKYTLKESDSGEYYDYIVFPDDWLF